MAAGTAAALVPIKSITMRSKDQTFEYKDAAEEPGPICTKLLATLKGIQQGKIEDKFGWLQRVEKPQGYTADVTEGTNGFADSDNVDKLP